MPDPPAVQEPVAGPSSSPTTRSASPNVDNDHTLRRPASHGRLAKLMIPGRSRSGSTASQAETTVTAFADDTTSSGGRGTPEQRWRSGKAATASLLASDAKYKKFAGQVDKCLQAFESVNEWADFISFLSRLLKTLQGPHPPYAEIPRKMIIAKRLAQCLNPALPSGVHQRALDVYAHIFATIGVEGLRRDLLIWSSGIFPFFQFAATSVRPILLNIYEQYYLPLADDLRPVTKAMILALLPGMEEETGDFFDKVLSLLSRVADAVGPIYFLQNVFLVLISSPASRLSAINYLSRKMVIPSDDDHQGIDVGLVIRGVAAVLEDENSLVRRGGLDLLLRKLPLDGKLFIDAEEEDRRLLIRAAVGVVLQREISLSRRVYTWLLGSDESSDGQIAHFTLSGLELLSSTLRSDMETAGLAEHTDPQRPFKVFLSLLDRWEVGSVLSQVLAVPALEAIKHTIEANPSIREEFVVTATAVYDAVEPIIIWKAFFAALEEREDDSLLRWTLQNLPQQDEEVANVHVPAFLDHILVRLTTSQSTPPGSAELADMLSRHVAPSLFHTKVASGNGAPTVSLAVELYTGDVPSLDTFGDCVADIATPRIVSNVFDLTADKKTSIPNTLTLLAIARRLIDVETLALTHYDGTSWLSSLIQRLRNTSSFPLVDGIVTTALRACHCPLFRPAIPISQPRQMAVILDTLFRFLRPDAAPFHARAVELLWEANKLAEIHSLEKAISKQLSADPPSKALASMEAFGTLWRLTDDAMLPGEMFHVPIFLVLDALRSDDPETKSAAETWMRCNLKSYFRILDPILVRLVESVPSHGGLPAPSPDIGSLLYLTRTLETLFKLGGHNLSKVCYGTSIAQTAHPTLSVKSQTHFPNASTYLDVLVAILLGHLENQTPSRPSDRPVLVRFHGVTLDVLEMLTGDLSGPIVHTLKSTILDQLSRAIYGGRCTLQYQFLRLLQILSSLSAPPRRAHHRSASTNEKPSNADEEAFELKLAQVIIQGVSSESNRPVLQHWVDFVLTIAPTLHLKQAQLYSICESFSLQVRSTVLDLRKGFTDENPRGRGVTDAEVVLLLTGLERLLALCGQVHASQKVEESRGTNEVGSGILGLVSGVFIAETPDEKPKNLNLEYLVIALEALLLVWTVTSSPVPAQNTTSSQSRSYATVASRNRQVLEKMFKTQTGAVIAGCISIWASPRDGVTDEAIFESIDSLTPSAQRVVEIISESAKHTRAADTSNATMTFLEAYISRLEAPIAVQIWGTMFAFSRDLLAAATTPTTKAQLYPLLRCLTVLCRTVSTTSALEDRRLRRDLQDVYPKVLDAVVGNMSKFSEVYAKRGTDHLDESRFIERNGHAFLAQDVIPNLRSFLVDQDKVAAACSSISLNIVSPALKQYNPTMDILRVILELTKVPPATKTWRMSVGDAFNDARFFKIGLEQVGIWKSLICALFDSDKERFAELLGRITAAPSANIFTNREQEMISRSSNLRRLSFVLLAADQNHYLTQLPAIQEKLVDILRTNVVSPRVHSEVYLCLRVIMCRISPQHLTNFWPVILAELLRVFEAIMEDVPADGSESLQLALAACKFLDLLLVIQSEDFQIHQWMFVTDTTDAVYPPEGFSAEAIMDTMAEILREHSHGSKGDMEQLQLEESTKLRRPRLSSVKAISSIHQLESFFSRASIDTFEGVYRDAGVDWAAVEEGLNGEIFE
ncbi:Dopey, N-terminal-domain-containing protein [Papiliotrema laurentii]|uniref:Dopey, N-terminal-domain-containing protein n=1 Tax=Papiliotrema laurentii TaxID=5418 RepID=A0AAD9L8W1_PAPLA|nr:Dopey, N-terminal-domain-containing protein [Papiliotrema laurentii]